MHGLDKSASGNGSTWYVVPLYSVQSPYHLVGWGPGVCLPRHGSNIGRRQNAIGSKGHSRASKNESDHINIFLKSNTNVIEFYKFCLKYSLINICKQRLTNICIVYCKQLYHVLPSPLVYNSFSQEPGRRQWFIIQQHCFCPATAFANSRLLLIPLLWVQHLSFLMLHYFVSNALKSSLFSPSLCMSTQTLIIVTLLLCGYDSSLLVERTQHVFYRLTLASYWMKD